MYEKDDKNVNKHVTPGPLPPPPGHTPVKMHRIKCNDCYVLFSVRPSCCDVRITRSLVPYVILQISWVRTGIVECFLKHSRITHFYCIWLLLKCESNSCWIKSTHFSGNTHNVLHIQKHVVRLAVKLIKLVSLLKRERQILSQSVAAICVIC